MSEQRSIDRILLAPLCWDEVVAPTTRRIVPGGAGFYAAHALAREGARVVLHTPLASSDRPLLEHLPPGVELVVHPSPSTTRFRLEVDPELPNERSLHLIDRCGPFDSNRIADTLEAGAILLGPLLPGDLDQDLVSLLASTPRPIDLGIQGLVRAARPDGAVEPMRPSGLSLPPIRILSGDAKEILTFTGHDDLDRALADLVGDRAAEAVATRGDRGAWVRTVGAGERFEIPAVSPGRPIRQTVGLGDTFLAVYGWHRSHGRSPGDAGHEAAMTVSRLMGARLSGGSFHSW